MTALVVILAAAGTYLILRGIRDWGRARAERREASSWIGQHQRRRQQDAWARAADESQSVVGWKS